MRNLKKPATFSARDRAKREKEAERWDPNKLHGLISEETHAMTVKYIADFLQVNRPNPAAERSSTKVWISENFTMKEQEAAVNKFCNWVEQCKEMESQQEAETARQTKLACAEAGIRDVDLNRPLAKPELECPVCGTNRMFQYYTVAECREKPGKLIVESVVDCVCVGEM